MSTNRRIVKIPERDSSLIIATGSINSIADVVIELVKNGLDAGATRLGVEVDFLKGSCAVEDNGTGLAPELFSKDSLLAGPNCTSKNGSTGVYGGTGTFLNSLAALSNLTIISRTDRSRLCNSAIYHHSRRIAEYRPAPEHHRTQFEHGTKVVVRDLFGNWPVRVKHRAGSIRGASDVSRLLLQLRYRLLRLLLAWALPAKVKLTEGKSGTVYSFGESRPGDRSGRDGAERFSLQSSLTLLTQMRLVVATAWPDWTPVSVSSGRYVIKGGVCKRGSSSKMLQFISFDIWPVGPESEFKDVYEHINSLFLRSSFGASTLGDGSSKGSDTNKDGQSFPAFILSIWTKDGASSDGPSGGDLGHIKDMAGLLTAQWLKVNLFKLAKPLGRSFQRSASDIGPSQSAGKLETVHKRQLSEEQAGLDSFQLDQQLGIVGSADKTIMPPGSERRSLAPQESIQVPKMGHRRRTGGKSDLETTAEEPQSSSIGWRDPESGKIYDLDPLTGMPLDDTPPDQARSDHAEKVKSIVQASRDRLARSSSSREHHYRLFRDWNRDVFQPSSYRVGSGPLVVSPHFGLDRIEQPRGGSFQAYSLLRSDLAGARVIGQVDQKFLLAATPASSNGGTGWDGYSIVLVDQHAADERVKVEQLLIQLCESPKERSSSVGGKGDGPVLAVNAETLDPPISLTGSLTEVQLLDQHMQDLANWGITFVTLKDKANDNITVYTLPPVISERCKREPALTRGIFQRYLAEIDPSLPLGSQTKPDGPGDDEGRSWVSRIRNCPRSIIDLVNSRACRSAVMFNDILGRDEAAKLLSDLGKCVFPFQCAHGRPSLVPLVAVEGSEESIVDRLWDLGWVEMDSHYQTPASIEDNGPESNLEHKSGYSFLDMDYNENHPSPP